MRIFATVLLAICVLSSKSLQQSPTTPEVQCMDASTKVGASQVEIKITCGGCQKWSMGTIVNSTNAQVTLTSKCTSCKSGSPLAGKNCTISALQVQNSDELLKQYIPCYDFSAMCSGGSWSALASISLLFISALLTAGYF